MEIINRHLPPDQYYAEARPKVQICLHHTVSAEADPAYNWWKTTAEHIGAAYIIEKDGTIFECFNPEFWAWHIGTGSTRQQNRQSIAIELVNEGWLTKKNLGYYWNSGRFKYHGKDIIQNSYRGQLYWPAYTDNQVDALISLTAGLCKKFSIPPEVYTGHDYKPGLMDSFRGVFSHCNVRRDKTDISPAFDLCGFQTKLKKLLEAK